MAKTIKKYFNPESNRTPESRHRLRQLVEGQPVTGTNQDLAEVALPEDTDSTGKIEELDSYQDLPKVSQRGLFLFGLTQGGAMVIGGVLVVAAFLAIIIYFNGFAEGIAENRTNVQNIEKRIENQKSDTERGIERVENRLLEEIHRIQDRFDAIINPKK